MHGPRRPPGDDVRRDRRPRRPRDRRRGQQDARVLVERRGDAFLLGLNRPAKHNALDEATVDALHGALREAARSPCVLVVHSTTAGVFAAGADIAELRARDADDALRAIDADLTQRVARHRWPSIAVVDGPALGGGCELALACDLRRASTHAVFAVDRTSWRGATRRVGRLAVTWQAVGRRRRCR